MLNTDFHGGDTGSTPVRDATFYQLLTAAAEVAVFVDGHFQVRGHVRASCPSPVGRWLTIDMPLPVAHGLLGAGVAAALHQSSRTRSWKLLLLGALLGICPDFDYALNWLRVSGGGWHHGFTHSFLFSLSLGLIVSLVLREWKPRSVVAYSAATLSHALLDFLITGSRGVALWWPFTDHRYKLRLPNPIDYTWRSGSLSEATADVLMISLRELIIFAPLLLAVLFVKRLSGRRPGAD